jgi:hypothetical protein
VPHGEYLLNRRGRSTPALTFSGRDAGHVRRVALGWWYDHRTEHGLFVRDFFARCRLSADGRTISYYAR